MATQTPLQQRSASIQVKHNRGISVLFLLLAMESSYILMNAVLPLDGLWFHTALISQLAPWLLLPTHLLFPGWAITPTLIDVHASTHPPVPLSWKETGLLLSVFLLMFLLYLLALRHLPGRLTQRSILCTTLLLGLTCTLAPIVTSNDIFSYIIYARMGAIYHLNPLTTLPTAVSADPVYIHLYWKAQPSAYGPVWVLLTSSLQWLLALFSINSLAPMVIALRLLGLVAHLCSTALIWSITGHLQQLNGHNAPTTRVRATLAFAWNPLLLYEACVNAHNDTVLLFLLLLALWLLVRKTQRAYLPAAAVLALATCLKVNIILLLPGLLLFLWTQDRGRIQRSARRLLAHTLPIALTLITYCGIIVLLYIPFWQHGDILSILRVNPVINRNSNTLPDSLGHLYNSITALLGAPLAPEIGSAAERLTHILSLALFGISYSLICWRALHAPYRLRTPLQLVHWMALAWLLYCATGSPWFWPWYAVLFFGLYALIEAAPIESGASGMFRQSKHINMATRILTFSLLSLYCFYSWGVYSSFVPGFPAFRWAYLRGLWTWPLPLLAFFLWFYLVSLPMWRKGVIREYREH